MSVWVEKASYHKISSKLGRFNPLIETLPVPLERIPFFQKMTSLERVTQEDRNSSESERILFLESLDFSRIPLEPALPIYREILAMIAGGYMNRNPLKHQDLEILRGLDKAQDIDIYSNVLTESGIRSLFLIGLSGTGKTTLVNSLLSTIPQVYLHKSYHEQPLVRTQITYLKVDCPGDATLGGFYDLVLSELSRVAGKSDYIKLSSKRSVDGKLALIAHLFVTLNVGLLVVDEIQNLKIRQKRGPALAKNLVTLSNITKVPMVFIGTPEAKELLNCGYAEARRLASRGVKIIKPLQEENKWHDFIKLMWTQQYLNNYTPLTPELEKLTLNLTQGFPGIFTALYKAVQVDIINDPSRIDEIILPEDFSRVAIEVLPYLDQYTKAMKDNTLAHELGYEQAAIDWTFLDSVSRTQKATGSEENDEIESMVHALEETRLFTKLGRQGLKFAIEDAKISLGGKMDYSVIFAEAARIAAERLEPLTVPDTKMMSVLGLWKENKKPSLSNIVVALKKCSVLSSDLSGEIFGGENDSFFS